MTAFKDLIVVPVTTTAYADIHTAWSTAITRGADPASLTASIDTTVRSALQAERGDAHEPATLAQLKAAGRDISLVETALHTLAEAGTVINAEDVTIVETDIALIAGSNGESDRLLGITAEFGDTVLAGWGAPIIIWGVRPAATPAS